MVGGSGDGVWSVQHPPQQVDGLLHEEQVSQVLQQQQRQQQRVCLGWVIVGER